MGTAPVQIKQHEPERRRRRAVTTLCCTCCTCCCCLHTLGSLVGSALAPNLGRGAPLTITYYYDEELGEPVPDLRKPGLSAVTVFWWISCLLVFSSFLLGFLLYPRRGEAILITALIVAMVFPLMQVVSAFLTLIVFVSWQRPDRSSQLKQLGKITGGVVLGSLLGILVMVGIAAGMGAFR